MPQQPDELDYATPRPLRDVRRRRRAWLCCAVTGLLALLTTSLSLAAVVAPDWSPRVSIGRAQVGFNVLFEGRHWFIVRVSDRVDSFHISRTTGIAASIILLLCWAACLAWCRRLWRARRVLPAPPAAEPPAPPTHRPGRA